MRWLLNSASQSAAAPAYQGLERAGIQPFLTELSDIDEAAQQYIEGTLVNHTERLH